jgi:hypothetical protein
MFFKKRLGKKAEISEQMTNVLIDLMLVALVTLTLLLYVNQVVTNRAFEKNYLARDISLLENTIYASPYDANVEYSTSLAGYTYDFKTGSVEVYLSNEEKNPKTSSIQIYPTGKEMDATAAFFHVSGDSDVDFHSATIKEDTFEFKKTVSDFEVIK